MRRRSLGVIAGTTLALAVAGTAFAGACENLSRAPAECGWDCPEPVIVGNWVWLPSVGEDEFAWGFEPPGTDESTELGLPGANGNYQNGFSEWLLGHSAYCLNGVNADKDHGVVSGCGE